MASASHVVCRLALAPLRRHGRAQPRTVKPDRAAINRLLDEFIPAAVAQKDLQRGWELSAGVARTVPHAAWMRGQHLGPEIPRERHAFHGWIVNYSYPGDVGFDILLQPTKRSLGAWSFRAEAQKIHGSWRITTLVPGRDLRAAGTDADRARPERPRRRERRLRAGHGAAGSAPGCSPADRALAAIALGRGGVRRLARAEQRARVRAIERALATNLERCSRSRAAAMIACASERFPNPRVSVFLPRGPCRPGRSARSRSAAAAGTSWMSAIALHDGSLSGTHSTFSSGPFSSAMWKTPTARTRIRQPGNVGSPTSTSASSGSPSSPSVPSTKP